MLSVSSRVLLGRETQSGEAQDYSSQVWLGRWFEEGFQNNQEPAEAQAVQKEGSK